MREHFVYWDVNGRNAYGLDGRAFSNDSLPYIGYKEKIKLTLQLINSATLTDVYTGFAAQSITCEAAVKNTNAFYYEGALTAGLSGSILAVTADGFSSEDVYDTGKIYLRNSAGLSETIAYTAYSLVNGVYTFTVSATLANTYANNDICRIVAQPLIAVENASINQTDKATGKFVIELYGYSQSYQRAVLNKWEISGARFGFYVLDSTPVDIFGAMFGFNCFSRLFDNSVIPPAPTGNYFTKSETTALIQAVDDVIDTHAALTATAHGGLIPASAKAAASGVASLDSNSKLVQNLDASKVTSGVFDIARIPAASIERLVQVADQTARYALTTATVQTGDTVKQLDDGSFYIVADDTKLNEAAGYVQFSSGTAASVPWTGITDKPAHVTELAGLTVSNDDVLQVKSGAVTNRTIAQLKTDLAYSKSDLTLGNVENVAACPLNGFVDRVATLSMSGSDFYITGNHDIYCGGVKYSKTTAYIGIANDLQLHYVYYSSSGVLSVSNNVWDILSNSVPIATVYKDGSTYVIQDERHGYRRSRAWHKWAHETLGCRFHDGLTGTFTNTTLSIAQGKIADEDIDYDTGGTKTACRLWYRNTAGTAMRFEDNISTPYKASAGTLQYDGGSGLVNVATTGGGRYANYFVYAAPIADYPIQVVVGQAEYASLSAAQSGALPTIPLTTVEWKLIYRLTYRNVAGTATFIEAADYRTVSSGPPTAAVANSHTALINRDATDSHPISAITDLASTLAAIVSDAVLITVTKTSHGLTSGDVNKPIAKLADGTYVLAQGDTAAKSEVIGVLKSVTSTSVFVIQQSGKYTWSNHNFTAPVVCLSTTSAGEYVTDAPTSGFIKTIFRVIDTDTLEIVDHPAIALPSGSGGGMVNPMTTAGDLIYGGSSGTPTRLVKGTQGHVLTQGATNPSWAAPTGMWTLVERKEFSARASDYTFNTNVDGDTARRFYMTGVFKATTANCTFGLRPNASSSGYSTQRMYLDGTGSATGDETPTNQMPMASAGYAGEASFFEFVMHAKTGLPRHYISNFNVSYASGDIGYCMTVRGKWTDTSANITSLQVVCSQTDGIEIGSYIELWKLAQ